MPPFIRICKRSPQTATGEEISLESFWEWTEKSQDLSEPPPEPILVEESFAAAHTTEQSVELLAGEAPEIGCASPVFAPKVFGDMPEGPIAPGEFCPSTR